jgi:hypothetical protein
MQSKGSVDFGRLLGFAAIGERLAGGVDFQDETFSDKLGAKIGPVEVFKPLEGRKLLGFAALGESLRNGVDFQDETFGARLGAKVGQEVCLALDLRDSGLAELAAEVDARVAAVGKKVET